MRGAWLALGLVLIAPLAAGATGERAPRGVALLRFRGPTAEAVQRAVAQGIEKQKGVTVVTLRGKAGSEAAGLELAKQAGAVCAVSGTVEAGRFRTVKLRVIALSGGQVLQEASLSAQGARGLKQLPRLVTKRLATGLETCRRMPLPGEEPPPVAAAPEPAAPAETAAATPPPEPTPSAAARPAPSAPAPAAPKASRPPPPGRKPAPAASPAPVAEAPSSSLETPREGAVLLDASLGASSLVRLFRYSDDLFDALREYNLLGSAMGALRVEAWPAARRGGVLAHLGLTASAEQSLLLKSGTEGGPSFATSAQRIALGLAGRLPVGRAELTLSGAYGWQDFSIAGEEDPARPDIPNVTYRFLRGGAGLRVDVVPRLAVLASAAYLHVLDSGQIATSDYFPRLTVAGVEASAGVAWQFASPLEVRAGVDYRRYFFDMRPEPGDRLVAGGALDHYVVATLALGLRLR